MSTHDAETACPGAVATRVSARLLSVGQQRRWLDTGREHVQRGRHPRRRTNQDLCRRLASQAGCPTLVACTNKRKLRDKGKLLR